jgi:hypothetical protein
MPWPALGRNATEKKIKMDLQEVGCRGMVGFDILIFTFKFIIFTKVQYQIITLYCLLLLVNSPHMFRLDILDIVQ